MPKLIYVIFVNTGVIGACLDAIRLLASPDAKRFSHVTVRGPYDRALKEPLITDLNSLLKGKSILIDGAGNFFRDGQNTVFFTCRGGGLKDVWEKTEFSDFNPHVTIYDGNDRELASQIFSIVANYSYSINCGEDKLSEIEIGNGTNGFLAIHLKSQDLPVELGLPPRFQSQISIFSLQERLEYIDRICRHLSSY